MDFSFKPNGAPIHEELAMLREFNRFLTAAIEDEALLEEEHIIYYRPRAKTWIWYSAASQGFTQEFVWLSPLLNPLVSSEDTDTHGFDFFKD